MNAFYHFYTFSLISSVLSYIYIGIYIMRYIWMLAFCILEYFVFHLCAAWPLCSVLGKEAAILEHSRLVLLCEFFKQTFRFMGVFPPLEKLTVFHIFYYLLPLQGICFYL